MGRGLSVRFVRFMIKSQIDTEKTDSKTYKWGQNGHNRHNNGQKGHGKRTYGHKLKKNGLHMHTEADKRS